MKAIYEFYWDCGRQGFLEGLFIADSDEVKEAIGKKVHFGEALGKHSEIYGELEELDVVLVTDDPVAINVVERYELTKGYNPLNYIEDDDD